MNQLPVLYKKNSLGGLQVWRVWVEADEVVTAYGQENGASQEARVRCEPTNVGRSNERNPVQQAEFEAQALHRKQISRKGYIEDRARAMAGENDQEGPIQAMLAHRYDKYPAKIKWPCKGQRKYDGLRCITSIEAGDVGLFSREGKPIGLGLEYLRSQLATIPGGHVLDGELYSFTTPFEKIVSHVRNQTPQPGNEVVEYHVYDYPSVDGPFEERWARLQQLVLPPGVILVETVDISGPEEVEPLFVRFKEEGFEGLMLRNLAGPYKAGKRSYDLQKVKFTSDNPYEEDEFPIVGVKAGRGKMAECAIFRCKTASGQEFDVKMKGALEELRKYLQDHSLWQNQLLTVTYQELSQKGVPRFPIGLRIRSPGL